MVMTSVRHDRRAESVRVSIRTATASLDARRLVLNGAFMGREPFDTPMAVTLTLGRRPIACVLPVACAALLVLLGLAPVQGTTLTPADKSAMPSGIGAGIYFVAGTADYKFELTQSGNYYLAVASDQGSTVVASISQNGTRLTPDWVSRQGLTLVVLDRGTYDLHLEGSGKVAVGWDFVFPGNQRFPADQRLVATLAPRANNRLTISLLSSSAPTVHILVYSEEMILGLDAVFSPGEAKTFDFPWSTSNFVTLVAETAGGPGNFSLEWSGSEAPVLQNSFLLPIGLIAFLIVLACIPAALIIERRRRHA